MEEKGVATFVMAFVYAIPTHLITYDLHKNKHILLYKAVRFLCLKLKISITTEPIRFYFLGKLHIGPVMVYGYFIFRFKSLEGFQLFSGPTLSLSIKSPRC